MVRRIQFVAVAAAGMASAVGMVGCNEPALKDKIGVLEDRNLSLQQQLAQAQKDVDELAAERDRLARQRDDCGQQLADARRANAELEQRLASAPQDVAAGWTPVEGGAMIAIEGSVLFESGKTTLRDEARRVLDAIVSTINQKYPDKDIMVFGHTDDQPIKKSGWEDNYELSVQRAAAVTRYLEKGGVSPARLIAAGAGSYRPRVPNDSESHRQKNRRVEFYAMDLELKPGGAG